MEEEMDDARSIWSIEFARSLENDELQPLIPKLIENAVYYEAWQLYFDFAQHNSVPVSESIIMEAVNSVGLDPNSLPLWLRMVELCDTAELKQSIFETGLTIPLYGNDALLRAYEAFCETHSLPCDVESVTAAREYNMALLAQEEWPDRYMQPTTADEEVEVRCGWYRLVSVLLTRLGGDGADSDMHVRRADLAFRQMTTHMAADDSCVAQYALFLLEHAGEADEARRVAEEGLAVFGSSPAIQGVLLLMGDAPSWEEVAALPPDTDDKTLAYMALQRLAGEAMAPPPPDCEPGGDAGVTEQLQVAAALPAPTREVVQGFRLPGKKAAEDALDSWELYHQWFEGECALTGDHKFAAKVLHKGVSCCSASVADSLLLCERALRYHTLRRDVGPTSSYAEQQLERAQQSRSTGTARAAWNTLVANEAENSYPTGKADRRRQKEFPQPEIITLLQQFAVGNYYPCSGEEMEWIQFAEDYAGVRPKDAEREGETAAAAAAAQGMRGQYLTRDEAPAPECVYPEESKWEEWRPEAAVGSSAWAPRDADSGDEITGPREMRGRLAYPVRISYATSRWLRLRHVKRERMAYQLGETGPKLPDSLARLVGMTRDVAVSAEQQRRAKTVSVSWLLTFLMESEPIEIAKKPTDP